MGWGEPHARSAGTTGDIERAHVALDALKCPVGDLATRTMLLAKTASEQADEIVRLREQRNALARIV